LLFLANMQIISLNMHDTKMAQAKINSTKKIDLGTTEKLLVPKFIELLWEYPCLCICTVILYNGAQRYQQFLQVSRLCRAFNLLRLAFCYPSTSVFDVHGAIHSKL